MGHSWLPWLQLFLSFSFLLAHTPFIFSRYISFLTSVLKVLVLFLSLSWKPFIFCNLLLTRGNSVLKSFWEISSSSVSFPVYLIHVFNIFGFRRYPKIFLGVHSLEVSIESNSNCFLCTVSIIYSACEQSSLLSRSLWWCLPYLTGSDIPLLFSIFHSKISTSSIIILFSWN